MIQTVDYKVVSENEPSPYTFDLIYQRADIRHYAPTRALTLRNLADIYVKDDTFALNYPILRTDHFRSILSKLIDLRSKEEQDEHGILRPTIESFEKAVTLLTQVDSELNHSVPKASVCTDSEGGIHIYWRNKVSRLTLIISPNGESKLFEFSQGVTGKKTEEIPLTIANLKACLSILTTI